MQEGLSGFLKLVALFVVLVRLKLEQKFLTDESSTPAVKSPKKRNWSYLVRTNNFALNISFHNISIYSPDCICLYVLMIYKWSKIRAWYPFWLSINEKQPWKFIGKNRNPIFLDCALFFKIYCVYICGKITNFFD